MLVPKQAGQNGRPDSKRLPPSHCEDEGCSQVTCFPRHAGSSCTWAALASIAPVHMANGRAPERRDDAPARAARGAGDRRCRNARAQAPHAASCHTAAFHVRSLAGCTERQLTAGDAPEQPKTCGGTPWDASQRRRRVSGAHSKPPRPLWPGRCENGYLSSASDCG